MVKRLAGIGLLLLMLAGLYAWYARSRDDWYAGALANGHVLRVGIRDNNPPFSFVDASGSLAGFDVDIAEALCAKLEMQCALVPLGWADSPITDLVDGKFDAAVSSLPIDSLLTPPSVRFTDRYYSFPATAGCCGPDSGAYPSGPGQPDAAWRFVAKRGATIEISAAGLAGKRVGFQDRAPMDMYLRRQFPDAVRVSFKSQAAANQAMAAGALDLLLGGERVLAETFLATGQGRGFDFAGAPLADPALLGTEAGIAVRSEDRDLLQALNAALAAIRADGTYKRINDRYFGFDISGG